jgi:alpha-glucosidase (family GH31 glycosyl hydrolase)
VNNKVRLYTGDVWPGTVHFVDYLHPNSTLFWKSQLSRLYNSLKFSGIWLDMNEPSNFRGGELINNEPFKIQHS